MHWVCIFERQNLNRIQFFFLVKMLYSSKTSILCTVLYTSKNNLKRQETG